MGKTTRNIKGDKVRIKNEKPAPKQKYSRKDRRKLKRNNDE